MPPPPPSSSSSSSSAWAVLLLLLLLFLLVHGQTRRHWVFFYRIHLSGECAETIRIFIYINIHIRYMSKGTGTVTAAHTYTHHIQTCIHMKYMHDHIDTQITYTEHSTQHSGGNIQRLRILLDILFTAEIFCWSKWTEPFDCFSERRRRREKEKRANWSENSSVLIASVKWTSDTTKQKNCCFFSFDLNWIFEISVQNWI